MDRERFERRPTPLPAPWEAPGWRPGADPMAGLPEGRDWYARRRELILDFRAERELSALCLAEKRSLPGKPFLFGRRLERHIEHLDTALAIWEAELATGAPPEDAPRALEVLHGERDDAE